MDSSISLCMVVKNEAEHLEDCLKHIAPWVREMIVVDTGSTDETPAIAARCGARLFSFPWNNDFAAARNFSLRQAGAPWILVLDADERLALRDAGKLPALLRPASAPVAYNVLARNYLNGSGQLTWNQGWQANTHEYEEGDGFAGYIDIAVTRLFPRHPQVLFSGCVHESVDKSLADCGIPVQPSGVVLHHYGMVRDSVRMRAKLQLYLELGMDKLKHEPNSARAHFELGIHQQTLKQYAEAIPHFLAAIKHDATFAFAHLYAGICHSRLEQYGPALQHLEKARRLLPASVELECELGLLDLKQGRDQAAAAWFEKILQREPKHVASLSYLGAVRAQQGKLSEGIRLLEKALEIDPVHTDSWVNLGVALQQSRQPERARQCYERALKLKPEDREIVRRLALSAAGSGRLAESAALLERAATAWPEDETVRTYWAAALAASGNEERALEVYQSVADKGGKLGPLARRQMEAIQRRRLGKQHSDNDNPTVMIMN
jgi:tetratricopeptide (TPR) repeat protein